MRAQPCLRVAAVHRVRWEQGKKLCSYGRFLVLNVTDSRRWRSRAIGLLQGRPAVAVMGRCREPTAAHDHHDERIHAWSLREKKPNWWKPGGLKPVAKPSAHIFVCVVMDEIAGRAASAAVAGVLRAEPASRPQRARVTGPAKGPGCRVSDVAVTPVSEARAATLPLS
ncbi:pyridoxamine 5'-phosphate oxidase family protein [Sinorhizobium meliloti]|nr:pyridoxamine 5'-phosphate oxidase family protein [Sinorhizobium meliloti]RVE81784.1 pyridoxamine 5'-phosphate oxidase family protein [Sinorhizobium meliloti]RVE81988.1 pyridoxamine 5'-phosphate oxidase family protein [Sinorhizobium meliloti]RVG59099.1 pyridoxamine 5'-phosphate oxidase family protein [Sinorhizobium meliloti]RVH18909.1 pyridoxamine 5'-phosphate oxidase family protein [Sinorhizobium meliloti]